MQKEYERLKQQHRTIRDSQPLNLSLRIHRALSWLDRAEQCEDYDGQFVFLWIAFNAAYATEILPEYRDSERSAFSNFFRKLCELDTEKQLSELIWKAFPSNIRVLLDNLYVNHDFWEWQRGNIDEATWLKRQAGAKIAAAESLAAQNTPETLSIVFSRIYVLRNQLMHGGATWNSSVNRAQIRDCVNFMDKFIVAMLEIMMNCEPTLWGDPCYPPMR